MKKSIVLGFLLVILFPFEAYSKELDLQKIIDQAAVGEEVYIPAGVYKGPITIRKEISLIGTEGVMIEGDGEQPIISVEGAKNVKIKSLSLRGKGTGNNNIGMLIEDSINTEIEAVKMTNVTSGLNGNQLTKLLLRNVNIHGLSTHFSKKGNGISIYNSKQVDISDTSIQEVQDGLYLEKVEDINLFKNNVFSSRYGIHFMYVDQATVSDNEFQKNVTGIMLMMTNNIDIINNLISDHQAFNGSGMVLYDAKNIKIENNEVRSNNVGLSLKSISDSIINNNQFRTNQSGITLLKSSQKTEITNNEFSGNIVNLRSDENGGTIRGNYYDDYQGLDIGEDGIGDTSYSAVQSFGQWMVREPVYQYFIEAPSVVLLNELDRQTKQTGDLLVDEEPKMLITMKKSEDKQVNLPSLIGGLLLCIGLVGLWRKEASI